MTMRRFLLVCCLISCVGLLFAQDEFLKIECAVAPRQIQQGNEGLLRIKIIPRNGVRISANPEFLIRLDENENLSLPVGSEIFLNSFVEFAFLDCVFSYSVLQFLVSDFELYLLLSKNRE